MTINVLATFVGTITLKSLTQAMKSLCTAMSRATKLFSSLEKWKKV